MHFRLLKGKNSGSSQVFGNSFQNTVTVLWGGERGGVMTTCLTSVLILVPRDSSTERCAGANPNTRLPAKAVSSGTAGNTAREGSVFSLDRCQADFGCHILSRYINAK